MKLQIQRPMLPILGALVLIAGVGAFLFHKAARPDSGTGNAKSIGKPRVPRRISRADFQRPMDQDLMERLRKLEASDFCKSLDSNVVKPFVDDPHTAILTVDGLEVTATQFPALYRTTEECRRILHLTQPPRVFVVDRPGILIGVDNFTEPVVVINTTVLRRFKDERELRFLIGREFGHVLAGHARWQSLLRSTHSGANLVGLGAVPLRLTFLPLFQWAREAELTADNAGLICAQDSKIAERALVRLATGIDDFTLREINVEEYLKQKDSERLSDFSELALLWKELNRPVPFAVDRIRELRTFEKSERFRRIWR